MTAFDMLHSFALMRATSILPRSLARFSVRSWKNEEQNDSGCRLTLTKRPVEILRDPLCIRTRRRIDNPLDAVEEYAAAVLAILCGRVACIERRAQLDPAVLPAHGQDFAEAVGVSIVNEKRGDDTAFLVVVRGGVGEGRGAFCRGPGQS